MASKLPTDVIIKIMILILIIIGLFLLIMREEGGIVDLMINKIGGGLGDDSQNAFNAIP